MKDCAHIWIFLLLVIFITSPASGQSTSFSYQGTLNQGGAPANGSFDFEFRLYDAISGGAQIGTVNTFKGVAVTGGRFTVTLSFGSNAFPGADRWIQISVRSAGGGAFTTLLPRQGVTPTPYAMTSIKAGSLTSTLSVAGGGTGAVDAATARSNLGVAASGVNSDITSLTGLTTPISVAQGGTGSGTANGARASLGAAASGVNSDITSLNGLTTPLASAQGGTGLGVGPTAQGQYLRAAEAGTWAIGPIAISDLPTLSGAYVDLTSNQTIDGNKTFTGTVSVNGNVSGSGTFSWQVVTSSQTAMPNRGYITDSTDAVTITLPSNPNIGDVIRINGLGMGGWMVVPNGGQSISTYVNSLEPAMCQTWAAKGEIAQWVAVASSADGTKLIAAAYTGQLYTSIDSGATWIARESNRTWYSVASSADGTKLFAAVRGGQIYRSTDAGATWTVSENNRDWRAISSSANGNRLVAVAYGGQIYTSNDSAVTWNARDSSRLWISAASSADGMKLVAVEVGGQIYTSTDAGDTWAARESNRNWRDVAVSADGSKFVAVLSDGNTYTSSDLGSSWSVRQQSSINTHKPIEAVASSSDGTRLVTVGSGSQIYISNDSGLTWSPQEHIRSWFDVASSADGTKLVAVAYYGQIYTNSSCLQLPFGSALAGDRRSSIEIVYVGNGRFLIVTASGNFRQSTP